MKRSGALPCLFLLAVPTLARGQVDSTLVRFHFKEAAALCERDGGKLWGISLCGPMVLADPASKTIAASQPPTNTGPVRGQPGEESAITSRVRPN